MQHTIHTILNPNNNESVLKIDQLYKDEQEGAEKSLHTVNTRDISDVFVQTDVYVACTKQNQPSKNGERPYSKTKGPFTPATFAAILSAIFSFEGCEEVNQL